MRSQNFKILILFFCAVSAHTCTYKSDLRGVSSDKALSEKSLPDKISFNYHIRPILSDRCFKCHGPDKAKIEAGLSLSNKEDAFIALGENKDHYAIIPGDAENSTLVERMFTDDESIVMPPPESNLVLSDYEKKLLKKWVEEGAEWEEHWAFDPLDKSSPPDVNDQDWAINGIDNYIFKKIESTGKSPSKKARKEHLIRRLAFDLTGLPPSLEEVNSFLEDDSEDAYEKLVDMYLNSPAYAEYMTGHWLDVARYADTHGYQDDLERVMWPWRDWVIHAFSENMPYDQFVKWQLAGDLLDNPTKEQIIATGFNRNHKITQEGGVIPEEYRVEYVSDRTMTFGKAFMGLTVDCAKCHDHKYDPISQKEYYSLFSFFNNVPEKGLIEEYGTTPAPFITLSKEEIEEQITFINNLDTMDNIELMVMEEDPTLRKSYILSRGLYDHPTEEVTPNTPEKILSFDGYEKNRKGLSEWLFDENNPLTARVTVNRFWLMCFGKGIVSTPDDFGAQGSLPSHPKLLDHLATKFIEDNWDIKALMKYMVMSNTYQQDSKVTPEAYEDDPENMLYARGSRVRLSAEKIRDQGLATSGLLVNKVGGPSVKPYQPEGLWKEVRGGGGGSTIEYKRDEDEKQYRRSLYTFWKRTVPPPDMMTFDAVTRDFCMVSRETTSTPLQALVMMNSPQVLEASKNLAAIATAKNGEGKDAISFMFETVTNRRPTEEELSKMEDFLSTEEDRFSQTPTDADELLSIGDSKINSDLSNVKIAAYTSVANIIYNLDESITRS